MCVASFVWLRTFYIIRMEWDNKMEKEIDFIKDFEERKIVIEKIDSILEKLTAKLDDEGIELLKDFEVYTKRVMLFDTELFKGLKKN